MKKVFVSLLFCLTLAGSIYAGTLFLDREALQTQLIRLHVVANSDEEADQALKLRVRDAVLSSIQEDLKQVGNAEAAKDYLLENLPKIERAANETLKALGCGDQAKVSLCREAFEKRIYDTFSLPAGIYEALRVTIGEGKGHNWWCVAFPSLCLPAASRDVEAMAEDAGLPESLRGAMTGRYELRFFFLDLLGKRDVGHES